MAVSVVSSDLALDPLISCKLCMQEHPVKAMHTMHQCSCIYCKKCLKQYLSLLISEGSVSIITCPDGECPEKGKINGTEIRLLVNMKDFERYRRLKFEIEVDLDPHRTWCPEVDCETICHVCSGDLLKARSVSCPTCQLEFCSVCKSTWHQDQTCSEYVNYLKSQPESSCKGRDTFSIPFESEVESNIKRCPMCHIAIERDEGCAQMMCKRCKHVFCWYCLTNLDDDFLLRHYDKGPCKDKLGHSRASILWHRTQVIGVFAGFGLLLLLMSPFLVLAAPCILCCKCKICKCFQDDPDIS
ncbi:probable E3 ubiquitin-protein ligase RNF144A-A [Antedon mediterranea]|uniref:probable E3 ubiquitin-protein ligase RNF144A-A n=1 Tax=Antedon mediterranea TaxID=105859 RepID=UPI003AF6F654